jgi:radical SAM superfamily enzyme YgiQ (UPF0313 family)
MFKDKKFRVRDVNEVIDDLEEARRSYRKVGRIFLADGDALVLTNEKLLVILDKIKELFPECERVGIYGSPQDVNRKSQDELEELRDNGIGIIYIGAESGSDRVLKNIKKGATRAKLIEAIKKIEDSGIQASVTFISGLSGSEGWEDHAIESGTMISESEPSYVGLLTLMVEPSAPMYADVQSERFKFLSPLGVIKETILMLENINVQEPCVFRSNHASNYISLKGNLPEDKEKMLEDLKGVLSREDLLKDDALRML